MYPDQSTLHDETADSKTVYTTDTINTAAFAVGIDNQPENKSPELMGFDTSHPVIRYFENLLSKNGKRGKSSFLVFKNNKYITIHTRDIAFFYIKNETPTIMSFGKLEYPITYSLDEVNRLISPHKFFRVNRQYLVNFSAVREVEHYFSRKLIVKLVFGTQEKLLVGKDKATSFFYWLENR